MRRLFVEETQTWMCLICGWIYDEALGAPDQGIPPGTRWADVTLNWTCPECAARKEDFELVRLERVALLRPGDPQAATGLQALCLKLPQHELQSLQAAGSVFFTTA